MAAAADARNVFALVRKGIDARSVHAHVRKPFRFLLCGDPALIAELRALLLSGHDDTVPPQAAACLETIRPEAPLVTNPNEVRAIVFLGRPGDAASANFDALSILRVPILAANRRRAGAALRSAGAALARRLERIRGARDCARAASQPVLPASRRMRERRRDRRRPESSRCCATPSRRS